MKWMVEKKVSRKVKENFFKSLFISFVRFYQKAAPKKLRESCRFTPSCSEYMILSIKKYGLIKGISKGIKRILICKVPNGGIDCP